MDHADKKINRTGSAPAKIEISFPVESGDVQECQVFHVYGVFVDRNLSTAPALPLKLNASRYDGPLVDGNEGPFVGRYHLGKPVELQLQLQPRQADNQDKKAWGQLQTLINDGGRFVLWESVFALRPFALHGGAAIFKRPSLFLQPPRGEGTSIRAVSYIDVRPALAGQTMA